MQLEYGKKELEQIAKLYGIKGAYKLKKAELVEAIIKAIPQEMENILPMLDKQDIERLEEVIQGEKTVSEEELTNYYNLLELELVQTKESDKTYTLKVAELVKQSYQNVDKQSLMEKIEKNMLLREYVISILNLYGIVTVEWATRLYNKYHTEAIKQTELTAFVKKDMRLTCQCKIMDGYIVEETVYALDKKNFQDFLAVMEQREYFVPTQEQLECMAVEGYYEENAQTTRLKQYIRNQFVVSEETIEAAVVAITMIARVDCDKTGKTIELMLDELAGLGFEFKDLAQVNELIKYIIGVVNTTRKWVNKGFTMQEISPYDFDATTGQKVKKLDVGRNEPCPCGSSKKYKKCCGK